MGLPPIKPEQEGLVEAPAVVVADKIIHPGMLYSIAKAGGTIDVGSGKSLRFTVQGKYLWLQILESGINKRIATQLNVRSKQDKEIIDTLRKENKQLKAQAIKQPKKEKRLNEIEVQEEVKQSTFFDV